MEALVRQGPFAPRALPRFNATMSPSDSRSSRHAVMGSRRLVDPWPMCQASLERVSQVPGDSVGIRCPLPPRRARPLQAFVASRSVTGFTLSGRAGHSQMRNEAESGSRFRITADAFAFQGSDRRITPTAARVGYMVNEQLPWSVPFN